MKKQHEDLVFKWVAISAAIGAAIDEAVGSLTEMAMLILTRLAA